MFVRTKRRGKHVYLQIVENERVNGSVRQHVLHSLGRLDVLQATGRLDGLMVSLGRFSEKLAVLDAAGRVPAHAMPGRRIGAALVFDRLWRELGIDRVFRKLLHDRKFEFDVERVVFVSVLHRLLAPGSDRQAERWQEDYRIPGVAGVALQHCYRAMGWLGSPVADERGATPFAPRCVKDEAEERLFAGRRHLFSGLDLVFMDTTSIYFEGAGGETLGQYGHSKDHRPDLRQMVVAVVLDGEGNPVCSELWPGNTADVRSLVPVAKRLRERFAIAQVCIVADRGMISKDAMSELERMNWRYILGVRMRVCREARLDVLGRGGRYQEVVAERTRSHDPAPLKVKEIEVAGRRYIVCLNEEQARKDAHDRAAIVASLKDALARGDKSLVGNRGYRKYLAASLGRFQIDEAKVALDARYDGKWVLTTNTGLSAREVALKYKQLWMVEDIFRSMKTLLRTRPVFHKCDETIRGHVWCSFLALVLRKELERRLDALPREADEPALEWADIRRDLEALTEIEIEVGPKRYIIRAEARRAAVTVFRACGIALPPTLRQVSPAADTVPAGTA